MLGTIREKDFIKWDWDVEIAMISDEFEKKFDLVIEELKKNNFD